VFKESADSSDDPGDTLAGHYLDPDMLDKAMREADEGATSAGYNKELINWKEQAYGNDYQELDDGLGYDELGELRVCVGGGGADVGGGGSSYRQAGTCCMCSCAC
jgi:hypothetical protein